MLYSNVKHEQKNTQKQEDSSVDCISCGYCRNERFPSEYNFYIEIAKRIKQTSSGFPTPGTLGDKGFTESKPKVPTVQ